MSTCSQCFNLDFFLTLSPSLFRDNVATELWRMLSFWEWTTKETLKKSSRKKLATATRKRPNCKWVYPLGALPSFSSPRQLHRPAKMPTWALVDFLPGLRISVLPLAAWRHCRQWCLVWWCVHTGILTAFHSTSLPSQGDLKQTDIISDQCEHNVPWRVGGTAKQKSGYSAVSMNWNGRFKG